jgi:hypothetical protein
MNDIFHLSYALIWTEPVDFGGEVWGSYGGGKFLEWWFPLTNVPAKHVSIQTLKSVYDQGEMKVKSDWISPWCESFHA